MIKVESLYSLCTVNAREIDWFDTYSEIQPNKFMYTALEISVSFQRDFDGVSAFICLVIFATNDGLGHNTDRSYTLRQSNIPIERVFIGSVLTQLDLDYISSFYPNKLVSSTKHYGNFPDDTLTLKSGDRYYPPNRSGYFLIQKIINGYDNRYPFVGSLDLYFDHFYPHIYQNETGLEFLIRKEIKRCCFRCESDYVNRDDDLILLNKCFLRTLPDSNYFIYDPDFIVRVNCFNEDSISRMYSSSFGFQIRGLQHTYEMFLHSTVSLSDFQNFIRTHFSIESTGVYGINLISEKPSFVFDSSEKVFCNHPDILSLILSSFQSLDPNIPMSIALNDYSHELPFCIYDPNIGDWMIPFPNPYEKVI